MNPLVVAEHDGDTLSAGTLAAIAAAKKISSTISILVLGSDCGRVAEAARHQSGVSSVRIAEHDILANNLPEACSPVIAKLAKEHTHVLMASSSRARNWMPRSAALCDCPMVTDVIDIPAEDTFVRPTYAGNAAETVRVTATIKFMTVRATAFAADVQGEANGEASILPFTDIAEEPSGASFVELRSSASERPQLADAQVVVAAGRGVGGAEGFNAVVEFADRIGAAVGASRAAVDAGYAPNDCQIGQTGKVIAPELYIAVGISGAIQHVAGIKDAKVIVAINKDEQAPIFEIADYGLVGDFKDMLPELAETLGK